MASKAQIGMKVFSFTLLTSDRVPFIFEKEYPADLSNESALDKLGQDAKAGTFGIIAYREMHRYGAETQRLPNLIKWEAVLRMWVNLPKEVKEQESNDGFGSDAEVHEDE